VALPVGTYLILRRSLNSDAIALAVTSAVPIAWMLAVGLWERRVDSIALLAAVVLAIALVISLASGGSALPLKLRRAVVSGTVGIACLASVIARRPLLGPAFDLIADLWPQSKRLAHTLRAPSVRQKTLMATAIIGVTALVDAAAQVALALTVSTATFLAVTGLTRLGVFAVGVGVCGVYLRGSSGARLPAEEGDQASCLSEHPPAHPAIGRET